MNAHQTNQNDPQQNIELRIRTMRILWLALFGCIGLYFLFVTVLVERSENITPNVTLSLALIVVALSTTLISFPIKNKLLSKAIEHQQVGLVQQAYIVAWAITEGAALLGILDFFVSGAHYYYIPFIIAAVGELLHFPRQEHVINASFKRPIL